jgi:hypothetical protein
LPHLVPAVQRDVVINDFIPGPILWLHLVDAFVERRPLEERQLRFV